MSGSLSSFAPPVVKTDGENWLDVVVRQVEGLKFGAVQITVHEGRVVQVETTVKIRFDKSQQI